MGHRGEVKSVAFSPNGKRIASGSFDNTLKVWDGALRARKLSPSWDTRTEVLERRAYSPGRSKRIVSGSRDNTREGVGRSHGPGSSLPHGTHELSHERGVQPGRQNASVSGSGDKTLKVWGRRQPARKLSLPHGTHGSPGS